MPFKYYDDEEILKPKTSGMFSDYEDMSSPIVPEQPKLTGFNLGNETALSPKPLNQPQDYTQQKMFGNMPVSQFVKLSGMLANALEPDGVGGRMGKAAASMAQQDEERAWKEKEYRALRNQRTLTNASTMLSKKYIQPTQKALLEKQYVSAWNELYPETPITSSNIRSEDDSAYWDNVKAILGDKELSQQQKYDNILELSFHHKKIDPDKYLSLGKPPKEKTETRKAYTVGNRIEYYTKEEEEQAKKEGKLGGPRYKPTAEPNAEKTEKDAKKEALKQTDKFITDYNTKIKSLNSELSKISMADAAAKKAKKDEIDSYLKNRDEALRTKNYILNGGDVSKIKWGAGPVNQPAAQTQQNTKTYSQEDLEFTAKKYNMTVDQVKQKLGIK